MSKKMDLMFCGLMGFASAGHMFGTFTLIEHGTGLFVWSLSGVLAAGLLTALNVLRNRRGRKDQAVAMIALVGNLAWIGIVTLFGQSIGNIADPRVLIHGFAALGLSYFSFQTLEA
jgi:hypothetical protein